MCRVEVSLFERGVPFGGQGGGFIALRGQCVEGTLHEFGMMCRPNSNVVASAEMSFLAVADVQPQAMDAARFIVGLRQQSDVRLG